MHSLIGFKNRANFSYCFLKISTYYRNIAKMSTDAKKYNIYVTHAEVPKKAIEFLQERCEVEVWNKPGPVPRDELLKKIKGKDGLFCILTDKIDKEVLDAAGPSLKVIGTMSVGYDHLDLFEARNRGIKLGYTPDVLTDATADLTVALVLAASRRLFQANKEIRCGRWGAWSPMWMTGPALKGSTLGMVGYGRIGRAVAVRLAACGVKHILYWGRTDHGDPDKLGVEFCPSFHGLLAQSDFVVVTCALTPDTLKLFNSEAFAVMKSSAVFVNTSRGGVVDQDALVKALQSGQIWAAGIDVTTPEPLPPDHCLLQLENCVVLPHIGSATVETRTEMAMLTSSNIVAALEGKALPAQIPS